jgi:hypothetical protein
MKRVLRHRPSPAMVVACIALVVALGGTGYATHERIFSSDIVNGEVRRVDLAADALPFTLVHGVEPGEVRTSNPPEFSADLGGPSVTVDVPRDALVGLFVSTLVRGCLDGSGGNGRAQIFEPTDFPGPGSRSGGPRVESGGAPGQPQFFRIYTGASTDLGSPEFGPSRPFNVRRTAHFANFYPATPGARTYTLKYYSPERCEVSFKDRHLWVQVLRPTS